MGGFWFVTLRDRYGVTQISTTADTVASLNYEDCVKITWTVTARPAGQTNDKMPTGEIEVELTSLELLGKAKELPFSIIDDPKTSEEIRMKHRYLDLRRRPVLDNVLYRARMNQFTRNRFSDAGFVEVQTPLFTVSSPEGARDYLIPSRVNPGQFYALPQAPQQYKQLLMIWWVDKYFQIAPCFRDEDPRADRHSCEFYQIDCEMSFVEQDDVHAVAQGYISTLIPTLSDKTIISPIERLPFLQDVVLPWSHPHFPKIPYTIAMELFGSDKPDLRFDGHMVDVTDLFKNSEATFIATPLANWAQFKAIRLAGQLPSRKEIDAMTEVAKQAGAGWLPYLQLDSEGLRGSIAKFVDEKTLAQLAQKTSFTSGDTLVFVLGTAQEVAKVGNKVRMDMRDRFSLVDNRELNFAWIVNFPFFEMNDEGKLDFAHNPFSMVSWGVASLQAVIEQGADPTQIMSEQYDMVCNGFEILSWSIRNHHPEVLVKAFEFVGKSEDDVKKKFWAMYEAFQYGCPPHGGFAFGFDRLLMILKDEPNIREIYAFPKSGRAEDVMMGAPSYVDEIQLDELSLKVEVKE
jgi:aspartyl-tRNA synthetase